MAYSIGRAAIPLAALLPLSRKLVVIQGKTRKAAILILPVSDFASKAAEGGKPRKAGTAPTLQSAIPLRFYSSISRPPRRRMTSHATIAMTATAITAMTIHVVELEPSVETAVAGFRFR